MNDWKPNNFLCCVWKLIFHVSKQALTTLAPLQTALIRSAEAVVIKTEIAGIQYFFHHPVCIIGSVQLDWEVFFWKAQEIVQ